MSQLVVSKIEEAFMQLHRQFFREMRQSVKDVPNISYPQMEVLHYLMDKKESSMKDLAAYLSIAPPSATHLVEALYSNGFVTRDISEQDRRTVVIAITSKAEVMIKSIREKKRAISQHLFEKLPDKDQQELLRILTQIIEE